MNSQPQKTRLDNLLTDLGLANSRSRARDMIARGCVTVEGTTISKPGAQFAPSVKITIDDPARKYVSRAALKLIAGLKASSYSPTGKHCVDLGASTGGFTQVMLEYGAAHVYAIDVGHGQLVPQLSNDDRVTSLEHTNARHLSREHFRHPVEFIVSDMSFVSLILAAEPALLMAAPKAQAILLVKPQFEVGKEGIGKGGLVKSEEIAQEAIERVQNWFAGLDGWRIDHLTPSPLTGSDGNQEYLLCGARDG